jgi:hypothetical protein
MITRQTVARKIAASSLPQKKLKYGEKMVPRLGVADVRAFGLTWEEQKQ